MHAPRFITFEGGEGAGKSTQLRRFSEWLDKHSIPHILTREPGGSAGAEAIRELIVTGDADRWDAKSEALLIMAARANHVQHTIQPALDKGTWVICDRFYDSTRVYQGISKGLGLAWLDQLYHLTIGTLKPHLTFLLDIDPKLGLTRTEKRSGNETRFEELPMAFHQQLREGFSSLAHLEPQRFAVIDAAQSLDDVTQQIQSTASDRLGITS